MSDLIRVAMVMHGYHPRVGGAERQVAALAPLLQAHGCDVQIVTRRYPGLAPFEIVAGVPVHRITASGPKAVAALSFMAAALRKLRELRPDVIHAHDLRSPTTTAALGKALLGVPVVATAHRGGSLGDVAGLRASLLGGARLAIFQQYIDAFTIISREIELELASVGVAAHQRRSIPNGVDVERFAPAGAAEKARLRAELGLPAAAPIAIYAGRLMPEKRIKHLIAIWPAVRAAHPDALLLVLGVGPEEAALKAQAGAGVQFAGQIGDVAPYLKAVDLFVLPSIAEGSSVALLEALASALPVVVTAVGGAPEVVTPGQHGQLVPPDDVAALQQAIIALLGDPELRARMGRAGRARVVQSYALPVAARRLRALYEQLVQRRPLAIGEPVSIAE